MNGCAEGVPGTANLQRSCDPQLTDKGVQNALQGVAVLPLASVTIRQYNPYPKESLRA
jgi:hypothetical protein